MCLNNNIDLHSDEIKEIVREMERVQQEKYPLNEATGTFNPEAIINYCIDHRIKPIYNVLYNRKNKFNVDNDFIKEMLENMRELIDLNLREISYETLPDEKNLVRRIIKYLEKHELAYTNPGMFKMQLKRLMKVIIYTYDFETLEYLVENEILKSILEKS